MTDHTHEIGVVDSDPCNCGVCHVYCDTCLRRMDKCPILDAPEALRRILAVCAEEDSSLAKKVSEIADGVLSGTERRDL
ncbi:hypothetical protein [Dermacoccus nishinomiyaensis]|uniref:hypothetical protein n=1 Tax=Dermacoccus nishinomiyaensis TaxID=1274 RepID=UPI00248F1581|nr:hypothetical protein [Dermacoccus nishinomiyaensis]